VTVTTSGKYIFSSDANRRLLCSIFNTDIRAALERHTIPRAVVTTGVHYTLFIKEMKAAISLFHS